MSSLELSLMSFLFEREERILLDQENTFQKRRAFDLEKEVDWPKNYKGRIHLTSCRNGCSNKVCRFQISTSVRRTTEAAHPYA